MNVTSDKDKDRLDYPLLVVLDSRCTLLTVIYYPSTPLAVIVQGL
jgi:hypothetical protein